MPFADPSAPSGGLNFKDHLGALLLIEVHGVEKDVQTVHGATDATSADVYVLEGEGAGEEYKDTLVFPKLLHGQLKGQIGQKVLGRLGQGQAKPGQSAPWLLNPASDADKQLAETWVSQNKPTTTAPAAPF